MKFIFRNTEEFRPKTNCLDAKTGRRHELEIGGGPGDWSISTDSEILAADLAMNRPWTMVMPARYAFPLIPNDLGLTNRRQCVFVAGRKAPLSWDRKTDTLEEIAPPAPPAEETDPYVDAVLTLAKRGNPVAKTLVDLVAAEVAAQGSAEQSVAAEAPAEQLVNVVPAEGPAPVEEQPEAPTVIEEPAEQSVAAEAPAEQPVAAEEPAQAAKKRANDLAARAKAAVK